MGDRRDLVSPEDGSTCCRASVQTQYVPCCPQKKKNNAIKLGAFLILSVAVIVTVICVLFFLKHDGGGEFDGPAPTCVDTDCSGHGDCGNITGSYECQCQPSFLLTADKSDCKASVCVSGRHCLPHEMCEDTTGGLYKCVARCPAGKYYQKDDSCTACESPYDRPCADGQCVPALLWCVAEQCQDGSDMDDCRKTLVAPCKVHQFRCDSLSCQSFSKWHDGTENCDDGIDEFSFDEDCKDGYVGCGDTSTCIHKSYVCDGVEDCLGGSDEILCYGKRNNKFQCDSNGLLYPRRKRCDGIHQDCVDGSDEPDNCECLPGQRKCDSNRCIEEEDWCDGIIHCSDTSDEMDCQELDCGTSHLCDSQCLPNTQVCDGHINCGDLSDELHCNCQSSHGFQCDNGACIQTVFVCNGVDDCLDNTDETNCTYCEVEGAFMCSSTGRCIPGYSVCDGLDDCAHGEDELDCPCEDSFLCNPENNQCVNEHKVCDGKNDCRTGTDEQQCYQLGPATAANGFSLVSVKHMSQWYPICSDNLDHLNGYEICHEFGKSYQSRKSLTPTTDTAMWLAKNGTSTGSFLVGLQLTPTCPSNKAVHLSCSYIDRGVGCGRRILLPHTDIIGGSPTRPGEWPWQIQLYKNSAFACGGSIINSRWIVTAAHCSIREKDDKWDPHFAVRVGSNKISDFEDSSNLYQVEKVIYHELYDPKTLRNDVALMKIKQPITFTDFVRPVCLPEAGRYYGDQKDCYITGWGTNGLFGSMAHVLEEMRATILPVGECQKHQRTQASDFPKVYGDDMICLNFQKDLAASCYGDSGGPMVCRQPDNSWKLIGLVSWHMYPPCHGYHMMTNLTSYVDWINNTMEAS